METSYKEKYEQALSKAKDMLNYKEVRREDMEYLFPELAESEDEKVKKRITLCLEECVHNDVIRDYEKDECIAWLENIPYTIDHEKREGFHLGYRACLEKQGEQKFEMKTAEESLGIDSDTYNKIVDECIFGEQKPADKVEPKFNVGDKIYLKPEYRMPNDDTPIANTVKEIRRIDDKHYRFDGSYIFIEDQDKYELVEQKSEENKGNIGGISNNPEWGEDDEAFLDDILCKLEHDLILNKDEKDWLKSLRKGKENKI